MRGWRVGQLKYRGEGLMSTEWVYTLLMKSKTENKCVDE